MSCPDWLNLTGWVLNTGFTIYLPGKFSNVCCRLWRRGKFPGYFCARLPLFCIAEN